MPDAPRIIPGGRHVDARGAVQHVNAFHPRQADRFYVLHPAVVGEVRGWVGHQRETKWFFPVSGRLRIGVVACREWPEPSRALSVMRYGLIANEPAVLEIPPGHFTAIVAEEPGSALIVFSTGAIEAAKDDDFRLPPDYWRFSLRENLG
jgi:dTDP-4-dehydrorhamnose 3,5-epimerase